MAPSQRQAVSATSGTKTFDRMVLQKLVVGCPKCHASLRENVAVLTNGEPLSDGQVVEVLALLLDQHVGHDVY